MIEITIIEGVMMMDFMTLAKTRQSVRGYLDKPVAHEDVVKCVEAARLAPSACNSQPWKMVVVDDPAMLPPLAEAISPEGKPINRFVHQVPVLVVVVEEEAVLAPGVSAEYKPRWVGIDNGSAIEHFCLQAAELGLGSCIMGSFDEKQVKKLLQVPEDRTIKVIIALGYPADETIRTKVRRELSQVVSYNRYQ